MTKQGGIWLVDGRAGGEGAMIAAAAYADGGARRLWVSRASQWLSSSDFMGARLQADRNDPRRSARGARPDRRGRG